MKGDDAGFTLMELMVSLGLMALVGVLMVSALRFGTQSWTGSETRITATEEITTIRRFVKDRLSEAYPLIPIQEENLLGERRLKFVPLEGRRKSVTFAASMPEPWGEGGLYWMSLYEEMERGMRVLKLAWVPFADEKANPRLDSKAVEAVLVDGIKNLDIDYLYRDPQTNKTRWRAAWLNEEALPELIRVNLTFEETAKVWTPLIIKPHITMDATCVFDPISRRCRKVTG